MTALQEDLEALRSALSTSVVLLSACRTGRFVLWQRAGKNVCKNPFEAEPQRGYLDPLVFGYITVFIMAETYRGRTYRRP